MEQLLRPFYSNWTSHIAIHGVVHPGCKVVTHSVTQSDLQNSYNMTSQLQLVSANEIVHCEFTYMEVSRAYSARPAILRDN